jgi:twinkle protein
MKETDSSFLYHSSCPDCGSSDALSVYSDNHTYCFACSTHGWLDGGAKQLTHATQKAHTMGLLTGTFADLNKRRITEDTCRKFGYTIGDLHGTKVQIAPYTDANGSPVAQKVRTANKDFSVLGDLKLADPPLFGAHLWGGGKRIVITEGEIDAMTVAQVQGLKWPAVSIPSGAQGARKAIARSLEYLAKFDEVVLMFDNDEPGRAAAAEAAEVLPPGKCKIASLPLKDANEMLAQGRGEEIVQAIWNAKPFRPDGLVAMKDLIEQALKRPTMGLTWWLDSLTQATYGRRFGEVYTFGAGTGVGKTDFLLQQMAHDLYVLGEPVGAFLLEQSPAETLQRLAGKAKGRVYHIPDAEYDPEELRGVLNEIADKGRLFLYDNFGCADWAQIAPKIRYLAQAEGVRIFYLDHLTALAAMETDERKALEMIMAEIAGLAKELNVMINVVSHLSTPEGKSHEEGGRVTIKNFKGSRAIGFWSHFMFGLERDQQDESQRNTSVFRILKDRNTGRGTGKTYNLRYDPLTGMLSEADPEDIPTPADTNPDF